MCTNLQIIHWSFSVKWVPRVFDFRKLLMEDRLYQENSGTGYKLTDFLFHSTRDELFIADSLGRLLILEVDSGKLIERKEFFRMPILSLALSPNGSYLGILFASGCCSVVSTGTFDVAVTLVQHQCDPNTLDWDLTKVAMVEDLAELKADYAYKLARGNKTLPTPDIKKKNYDRAFKVVCPLSHTSLKVFLIEKNVTNLKVSGELVLRLKEEIQDFKVHPSLNYLIVTTTDGAIHLYSFKDRKFV